jgi:hypothetical protein
VTRVTPFKGILRVGSILSFSVFRLDFSYFLQHVLEQQSALRDLQQNVGRPLGKWDIAGRAARQRDEVTGAGIGSMGSY